MNWYVVNHDTNERLRGPYKDSETACAVRTELENANPDRDWNLWVDFIEELGPMSKWSRIAMFFYGSFLSLISFVAGYFAYRDGSQSLAAGAVLLFIFSVIITLFSFED